MNDKTEVPKDTAFKTKTKTETERVHMASPGSHN